MASTIKVDKIEGSTGSTITVPTGQTLTLTDGLGVSSLPTVTVAKGGTNLTSFTAGDVLYATGATTLAKLAKGTAEQVLAMNAGATAPDWGSVDLTVLPTITVAKGGTNISSFAAGDILYATGATTLTKLVKGSAADVLTMNAGATAPEWAASAGGGKIGQVISASQTDALTASPDATFTNITGLSCAITPAATSSKIWVMYNLSYTFGGPNNSSAIRFARDGTAIGIADVESNNVLGSSTDHGWDAQTRHGSSSQNYLDSPSSTSELTYTIQWVSPDTATLYLNRGVSSSTGTNVIRTISTMTVMEVLA